MTYYEILSYYNLNENQIADMFKISVNELNNTEIGKKIKQGIEQFHYNTCG